MDSRTRLRDRIEAGAISYQAIPQRRELPTLERAVHFAMQITGRDHSEHYVQCSNDKTVAEAGFGIGAVLDVLMVRASRLELCRNEKSLVTKYLC